MATFCIVIWESRAIKTAISFLPTFCLFFFRNWLIPSGPLLWLAFKSSYPTECLSSIALELYEAPPAKTVVYTGYTKVWAWRFETFCRSRNMGITWFQRNYVKAILIGFSVN